MFKNIHDLLISKKSKSDNKKDFNFFDESLKKLNSDVIAVQKGTNSEEELKLTDIIIFEAMMSMYMDILEVSKLDDYRDPIALLSFHFDQIYPGKNISFNDLKVANFAKLFSHIEERHLIDVMNSYIKASRMLKKGSLLFKVEVASGKISVQKNDLISRHAEDRNNLYEKLMNLNSDKIEIFDKASKKDVTIDMKKTSSYPKDKECFLSEKDLKSGTNEDVAKKDAAINNNKNSGADKGIKAVEANVEARKKHRIIIDSKDYINKNRRKEESPKALVYDATRKKAQEIHRLYFPGDNTKPQKRFVEELLEEAIKDKKSSPKKTVENKILESTFYENVSDVHVAVSKKVKFYKNNKDGTLLEVNNLKDYDTSFELGNPFYYSGATGSGKSKTTESQVINWLLQGLKVVYLSKNLGTSIDMFNFVNKVRREKQYDFEVPFLMTGRDKQHHKLNYILDSLNGIDSKYDDVISLYTNDDEKELLEQLDTTCLLDIPLGIGPDLKGTSLASGYYCNNLKYASSKDKKKKSCNLYGVCGYYKRFEYMKKSSLWIVNLDALALSSMPEIFDPYQRSLLEVATTWADIIIKDEADEGQANEEALALSEVTLSDSVTRDSNEQHGKSILDAVSTHEHLINKATNSASINRLRANLPTATKIDKYIHQRIKELDDKIISKFTLKFNLGKMNRIFLKEYSSLDNIFENIPIDKQEESKLKNYIRKVFNTYIKESASKDKLINYLDDISLLVLDDQIQVEMYNFISEEAKKAEEYINTFLKEKEPFSKYPLEFKIDYNTHSSRALFSICQMFSLWDKVITSEIEPSIPLLMYRLIEEQSHTNATLEKVSPLSTKLGKHRQYLPKPVVDINGYKITNPIESDKDKISIKKGIYEGKSSRLIKNANLFYSNQYGVRPASIVYTSATSVAEGSSLYNIYDEDVDYIIRHDDQENQKVEFIVDIFLKNDKPISVSGIEKKEKALKDMVIQMSKEDGFLAKLDQKHSELERDLDDSTPITLLVTNSNSQAKLVGQSLVETNLYSKEDVAVLIGANESVDETKSYQTIKVGDLSTLYDRNIKTLVSSSMVIKRAHNILRSSKSQKSLIYDIVFMIRPYPSPDDDLSLISLVHAEALRQNNNNNLEQYGAYGAYRAFIEKCNAKLSFLIEGGRWSDLNDEDREAIAINVFVDIITQTSGRGRRGGTNVRVHLSDYALFNGIDVNSISADIIKTHKKSMVYYWLKFLNNESEIYDKLYRELKHGLNNMKINIHR